MRFLFWPISSHVWKRDFQVMRVFQRPTWCYQCKNFGPYHILPRAFFILVTNLCSVEIWAKVTPEWSPLVSDSQGTNLETSQQQSHTLCVPITSIQRSRKIITEDCFVRTLLERLKNLFWGWKGGMFEEKLFWVCAKTNRKRRSVIVTPIMAFYLRFRPNFYCC